MVILKREFSWNCIFDCKTCQAGYKMEINSHDLTQIFYFILFLVVLFICRKNCDIFATFWADLNKL